MIVGLHPISHLQVFTYKRTEGQMVKHRTGQKDKQTNGLWTNLTSRQMYVKQGSLNCHVSSKQKTRLLFEQFSLKLHFSWER
jgi:hypothetical protein